MFNQDYSQTQNMQYRLDFAETEERANLLGQLLVISQ